MDKRQKYPAEFKLKVVLEILREVDTVSAIATKYQLHPVMLSNWKTDFLKRASSVFEKDNRELDKVKRESEEKIDDLKKLVGQLTYEVDWMKKKGGF